MTSVPEAAAPHIDPLASFDLESLVSGAARLRAERAALGDSTTCIEPMTFAEFDRRVSALAGFWRDLGLQPGERILLAGGATATSVIALFAAMRAGLDAALAPLHLDRVEMVDFACRCDAAALAAEAVYGESWPAEDLMGVASRAPRVRFVCSLGGGDVDGAVDADPAKLVAPIEAIAGTTPKASCILTRSATGEIVHHKQRTLVATALDLVTRAQIGMRLPIVTTIAPTTFAGLCAGPIAALLAGAPLLLHGPFQSAEFSTLLRRWAPAHLVSPSTLLGALNGARLVGPQTLASLILVSRHPDLASAGANTSEDAGETVPIIDLFAIGERAAVPEPRQNGRALLAEAHYISLDEGNILAVGRGANSALEGAAVTMASEIQPDTNDRGR